MGVKPQLSPSPALLLPWRMAEFNNLQASPPCSFNLSQWAWPLGDTRQHLVQVHTCSLWSSWKQGDIQVGVGEGRVIKALICCV